MTVKYNLSVEEIYPFDEENLPAKLKERGTCHVRVQFPQYVIDIKNMYYSVDKKNRIFVIFPGRKHNDVFVHSITFSLPKIKEDILNLVKKEVKEQM